MPINESSAQAKRLQQVQIEARENIKLAQKKQKERYDEQVKDTQFHIGDKLEEQTPLRFLPPYDTNDLWETALSKVVYKCQEAMKDKHRIRLLANSYYLGAKRVLEIFRRNPEQIYRTRKIFLHFLDGLTDEDYNNKFLPYTQTSLDFVTLDMRNSFNTLDDLAS
ncbi:16261_t:CDS:2 [Dentiscutata erythropus]|uniref:16261_t:CDS:1 n=1 Tax=Dentiscutata erythropus TaxID=1348616 RepID=A0A9N9CP54_9GLOM|nr:16261_t:CDS:2 [Dentiscutata erythropus]